MDKLLTIEEVARLFSVSESRARQILANGLVTPRTGYSESAVRRLAQCRSAPTDPAFYVVPPDAQLPEMVIHEQTGWKVYPAHGIVYSTFTNAKTPQPLGSVKTGGHLVANRTHPDGTRQYRLSRIIWEVVNRRPIPEGWVIFYRNNNRRDVRYSNLGIEPVAKKIARSMRNRRLIQREAAAI